jgi:hypothetical protein
VAKTGKIYTYHFNLLRNVLEKTATFHGFDKFSDCIKDSADKSIHARRINILSQLVFQVYSLRHFSLKNICLNFLVD